MEDNKDLLTGSDTVQDIQIKAATPVTEVTSIAKEEEKTGQKIELPSAEELVARASSSVIGNLQAMKRLIGAKNGSQYVISRKGMNRIMEAIFDLPTEGQKVMLQGKEEKQAFFIGQNLMRSLFILMQNHVNEEMKKRKEAQETAKQEETKTSEGENDESREQ